MSAKIYQKYTIIWYKYKQYDAPAPNSTTEVTSPGLSRARAAITYTYIITFCLSRLLNNEQRVSRVRYLHSVGKLSEARTGGGPVRVVLCVHRVPLRSSLLLLKAKQKTNSIDGTRREKREREN